MAGVCSGASIETASDFAGEPGTHPIILLKSNGDLHNWTALPPIEWWPDSTANTQLVACLDNQVMNRIQICNYTGGGFIRRYRYELPFNVILAKTGEYIGSFKLYGEDPDWCPQQFSGFPAEDGIGDPVSFNQLEIASKKSLFNFLNRYNKWALLILNEVGARSSAG